MCARLCRWVCVCACARGPVGQRGSVSASLLVTQPTLVQGPDDGRRGDAEWVKLPLRGGHGEQSPSRSDGWGMEGARDSFGNQPEDGETENRSGLKLAARARDEGLAAGEGDRERAFAGGREREGEGRSQRKKEGRNPMEDPLIDLMSSRARPEVSDSDGEERDGYN